MKKLYRSKKNRTVCGVCGGIAEYFDCDYSIVIILTVIISLVTALVPAIIVYLILSIVIPENDSNKKDDSEKNDSGKDDFDY